MFIVLVQMNANRYLQSDPCKAEDFSANKAKEKFFSASLCEQREKNHRFTWGQNLVSFF